MKRALFIGIITAVISTSCSLLTATLATPTSGTQSSVATQIIAPSPHSLTCTEDPGTGLYGYLNHYGRWAIAPQYRYATDFNREVGIAVVEVSRGHYGGINTLGQIVIQPNFTSSYSVSSAINCISKGRYCGVDLWEEEDRNTELYGYLNYYGEWHIAPQFHYAADFNDDLNIAVVGYGNSRYGAINKSGQVVIKPNFTSSYDVSSAINSISKGRYCGIDLWETKDPATGLYGYLNYYGEWHIAPQYTYAQSMTEEGLAVVEFSNRRWGVIDRMGNIVIEPNFTSSYDASSALNNLLR